MGMQILMRIWWVLVGSILVVVIVSAILYAVIFGISFKTMQENPKLVTDEVKKRRAGGFKDGDAVVHDGRDAHVGTVLGQIIPKGHIPIKYDDEEDYTSVPADSLYRAPVPLPIKLFH